MMESSLRDATTFECNKNLSSNEIMSLNEANDVKSENISSESTLSESLEEIQVQTVSKLQVPEHVISETNNNDVNKSAEETNENSYVETVDITPEKSGGVMKQIIKPGEGDKYPEYGDRVIVHYTGWLLNKEKPILFDSNRKDEKSEFNLGRGVVIRGWDLGISTMKKGEIALFIIQPNYAYGDMGNPPTIPAHTPLLFEIELYGWKLEDLSPKKDGGILRKIIDKGEGSTSPNEGAQVKVRLTGKYKENIFEDCEKVFQLGEGCLVNIPDGIEMALLKFRLNETSLLYLKSKYGFEKGLEEFGIPPETDIMYEISLLDFIKAKDVWEMSSEEKFEKAKLSKEKGISFTKAGFFKVALRHFKWIPACLEKEPGVDPESKESRNLLLLSGFLNIALCHLKLENYVEAIKFCDKVLELQPKNEKAIFRRGQAKMLFNDCEEALLDFEQLCSFYPSNKAAKQYSILCKDKIREQNQKDKSIYNKMFDKFMQRDREKMKNMRTETGIWQSEEPEEGRDVCMNETQKLIEQNNCLLREANIIELSNTAC